MAETRRAGAWMSCFPLRCAKPSAHSQEDDADGAAGEDINCGGRRRNSSRRCQAPAACSAVRCTAASGKHRIADDPAPDSSKASGSIHGGLQAAATQGLVQRLASAITFTLSHHSLAASSQAHHPQQPQHNTPTQSAGAASALDCSTGRPGDRAPHPLHISVQAMLGSPCAKGSAQALVLLSSRGGPTLHSFQISAGTLARASGRSGCANAAPHSNGRTTATNRAQRSSAASAQHTGRTVGFGSFETPAQQTDGSSSIGAGAGSTAVAGAGQAPRTLLALPLGAVDAAARGPPTPRHLQAVGVVLGPDANELLACRNSDEYLGQLGGWLAADPELRAALERVAECAYSLTLCCEEYRPRPHGATTPTAAASATRPQPAEQQQHLQQQRPQLARFAVTLTACSASTSASGERMPAVLLAHRALPPAPAAGQRVVSELQRQTPAAADAAACGELWGTDEELEERLQFQGGRSQPMGGMEAASPPLERPLSTVPVDLGLPLLYGLPVAITVMEISRDMRVLYQNELSHYYMGDWASVCALLAPMQQDQGQQHDEHHQRQLLDDAFEFAAFPLLGSLAAAPSLPPGAIAAASHAAAARQQQRRQQDAGAAAACCGWSLVEALFALEEEGCQAQRKQQRQGKGGARGAPLGPSLLEQLRRSVADGQDFCCVAKVPEHLDVLTWLRTHPRPRRGDLPMRLPWCATSDTLLTTTDDVEVTGEAEQATEGEAEGCEEGGPRAGDGGVPISGRGGRDYGPHCVWSAAVPAVGGGKPGDCRGASAAADASIHLQAGSLPTWPQAQQQQQQPRGPHAPDTASPCACQQTDSAAGACQGFGSGTAGVSWQGPAAGASSRARGLGQPPGHGSTQPDAGPCNVAGGRVEGTRSNLLYDHEYESISSDLTATGGDGGGDGDGLSPGALPPSPQQSVRHHPVGHKPDAGRSMAGEQRRGCVLHQGGGLRRLDSDYCPQVSSYSQHALCYSHQASALMNSTIDSVSTACNTPARMEAFQEGQGGGGGRGGKLCADHASSRGGPPGSVPRSRRAGRRGGSGPKARRDSVMLLLDKLAEPGPVAGAGAAPAPMVRQAVALPSAAPRRRPVRRTATTVDLSARISLEVPHFRQPSHDPTTVFSCSTSVAGPSEALCSTVCSTSVAGRSDIARLQEAQQQELVSSLDGDNREASNLNLNSVSGFKPAPVPLGRQQQPSSQPPNAAPQASPLAGPSDSALLPQQSQNPSGNAGAAAAARCDNGAGAGGARVAPMPRDAPGTPAQETAALQSASSPPALPAAAVLHRVTACHAPLAPYNGHFLPGHVNMHGIIPLLAAYRSMESERSILEDEHEGVDSHSNPSGPTSQHDADECGDGDLRGPEAGHRAGCGAATAGGLDVATMSSPSMRMHGDGTSGASGAAMLWDRDSCHCCAPSVTTTTVGCVSSTLGFTAVPSAVLSVEHGHEHEHSSPYLLGCPSAAASYDPQAHHAGCEDMQQQQRETALQPANPAVAAANASTAAAPAAAQAAHADLYVLSSCSAATLSARIAAAPACQQVQPPAGAAVLDLGLPLPSAPPRPSMPLVPIHLPELEPNAERLMFTEDCSNSGLELQPLQPPLQLMQELQQLSGSLAAAANTLSAGPSIAEGTAAGAAAASPGAPGAASPTSRSMVSGTASADANASASASWMLKQFLVSDDPAAVALKGYLDDEPSLSQPQQPWRASPAQVVTSTQIAGAGAGSKPVSPSAAATAAAAAAQLVSCDGGGNEGGGGQGSPRGNEPQQPLLLQAGGLQALRAVAAADLGRRASVELSAMPTTWASRRHQMSEGISIRPRMSIDVRQAPFCEASAALTPSPRTGSMVLGRYGAGGGAGSPGSPGVGVGAAPLSPSGMGPNTHFSPVALARTQSIKGGMPSTPVVASSLDNPKWGKVRNRLDTLLTMAHQQQQHAAAAAAAAATALQQQQSPGGPLGRSASNAAFADYSIGASQGNMRLPTNAQLSFQAANSSTGTAGQHGAPPPRAAHGSDTGAAGPMMRYSITGCPDELLIDMAPTGTFGSSCMGGSTATATATATLAAHAAVSAQAAAAGQASLSLSLLQQHQLLQKADVFSDAASPFLSHGANGAAGGGGSDSAPCNVVQAGAPCNVVQAGAPAAPVGSAWHRIHARVMRQPAGSGGEEGGGRQLLVITQIDITDQVEATSRLEELLAHEHTILEQIFPRHVIEYFTVQKGITTTASAAAGQGEGPPGPGPGAGQQLPPLRASSGKQLLRHRSSSSTLEAGQGDGAAAGQGQLTAGTLKQQLQEQSNLDKVASLATSHKAVTILFADIVGFTNMCNALRPLEVMRFLNQLYSKLDSQLDIYRVYKVETIGDCYMVAGGLVRLDADGYRSVLGGDETDPLHAVRALAFAKAMLRAAREVTMPTTGQPVQLRIGLHSGPVMSGIVGSTMPRFCLFGDTVNTASRMESTCPPGRIHVSEETHELLPNEKWQCMGDATVKGKGQMRTYAWAGPQEEDQGALQRVLNLYL